MPREVRTCGSPGCERKAHAQGLCQMHYGHARANVPGAQREENGLSREKRLESLLSLCDGFLHTLNALSDITCRQAGRTRSPPAQRLYELANEIRARIAREHLAP